jgi:hypothetical protein
MLENMQKNTRQSCDGRAPLNCKVHGETCPSSSGSTREHAAQVWSSKRKGVALKRQKRSIASVARTGSHHTARSIQRGAELPLRTPCACVRTRWHGDVMALGCRDCSCNLICSAAYRQADHDSQSKSQQHAVIALRPAHPICRGTTAGHPSSRKRSLTSTQLKMLA